MKDYNDDEFGKALHVEKADRNLRTDHSPNAKNKSQT